ncbi:MAG: hypothetical protein KG028_12825 [Actinobacteria bacterium]|jgi:hypothetical protein|nr:hypothetical protein [Actinomycetota bacterium]
MTNSPRFPDDDAAVDGSTRDALWRLRARLITPPASERAERDLQAIYAAAADYAHEDPTVRQLHDRRFVALERIGRVAAVVVLIGGTAASVTVFDRDPVQFPVIEGSSDSPVEGETTTAAQDAEAADAVSEADESGSTVLALPPTGEPAPVATVTVTETETATPDTGQVGAPSSPTSAPTTSAPSMPTNPPATSEPEPAPSDEPSTAPTDDRDGLGGFGGRGERPCPTPSPTESDEDPDDASTEDGEVADEDETLVPPCPSESPTPTPTESETEGDGTAAKPGSTEPPSDPTEDEDHEDDEGVDLP